MMNFHCEFCPRSTQEVLNNSCTSDIQKLTNFCIFIGLLDVPSILDIFSLRFFELRSKRMDRSCTETDMNIPPPQHTTCFRHSDKKLACQVTLDCNFKTNITCHSLNAICTNLKHRGDWELHTTCDTKQTWYYKGII